ncbi:MAG: FAD-binding oxidoreductase [Burkholderiaceae bacterium]
MIDTEIFLEDLLRAVGPDQVVAGAEVEARYFGDWALRDETARPVALVRPRDTAAVAATLRTCDRHRVPVVGQGGRTGLTGAAVPCSGGVILSLERMNAIGEVDPASGTIEVEAGAILEQVQRAADAADAKFALDIPGRGSCTIGGNISTNAGGNHVVRYGMMREQVLGLEAVLADGTVLSSMNRMLKNNAGYDLKQLFIGSEGTLGVVTRAVLRVFPKCPDVQTCLCAVRDVDGVLALLALARHDLGDTLSAFEVMWPSFYEYGSAALDGQAPLPAGHGAYVLIETEGVAGGAGERAMLALLEAALERAIVADAVAAQSLAQRRQIWAVRDSSGQLQNTMGPYIPFDISVPIGEMGPFVAACEADLRSSFPTARWVFFGHVADSNLHICVTRADVDPDSLDRLIYDRVATVGGSVSAEHGIGLLKRDYLDRSRSAAEIEAMRRLKRALDPNGILNPGKVFAADRSRDPT